MKLRITVLSVMIITILGLILSCGKNSISEIKTEELLKNIDNPNYVIIDTKKRSPRRSAEANRRCRGCSDSMARHR